MAPAACKSSSRMVSSSTGHHVACCVGARAEPPCSCRSCTRPACLPQHLHPAGHQDAPPTLVIMGHAAENKAPVPASTCHGGASC
jgi:hypothetical protein